MAQSTVLVRRTIRTEWSVFMPNYTDPYQQTVHPDVEEMQEEEAQMGGTEGFVAKKAEEELDSDQGVEIPVQHETESEEESEEKEAIDQKQFAEELEAMRKTISDLKLRQAADMENFKKRLQREHQEQLQYAAEKVLSDLLPTLDNLELAMQYGNASEVCKDVLQGVAMTHKLLMEAVKKHGLVPVGEVGEAFNPAIHEAVGFDQESEAEKQTVTRVLQRGYMLGNRLLRAARVMIAN